MIVNIVMLAHNRHMLTHQALRTLYRNTPMDMFNIVVVDDASGVPVTPLRKEHEANFTCLRINQSKGVTGLARNLGVWWAEKYWGRGDWLYLSDNDCYFSPGWLETLTGCLTSAEREDLGWRFKLMGGWNHPFMQPNTKDTYKQWPNGIDFNERKVHSHDAIAGASQLMRWKTWDGYGPLDAHAQGVCQGEDWQFCQNIIKDGGRVGSIYPRVVFNCGLTNSFGQPSVGADIVLEELQEAKKQYPDLYYE